MIYISSGCCCCCKESSKALVLFDSRITFCSSLIFVLSVYVVFMSSLIGQSFFGVPKLFGPSTVLVDNVEEFTCELLIYPKNESILLQLYK